MIVRGLIDYMRRYSTIVPVACSTRLDTKSKFRALVCVDAGIAERGAVHNIKKCSEETGQGGYTPGVYVIWEYRDKTPADRARAGPKQP